MGEEGPVRFVDGELVEAFLDLGVEAQERVVEGLEVGVEEVRGIVEGLKRIH
jgi:DNA damage-binding protein 1